MCSYTDFLAGYSHIFDSDDASMQHLGTSSLPIPTFNAQVYTNIFSEGMEFFRKQDTVLKLDGDFVLVGDIHGNIRDLFRIIKKNGHPSTTRYLFLGDYVDRGCFSLECIAYLVSLVLSYPDNVFLLRGNHEFPEMNIAYGFKAQVEQMFTTTEVFEKASVMFEYLPIAAIIQKSFFAVHGGISNSINNIKQLEEITRPINSDSPPKVLEIVDDLLWSDPDKKISFYAESFRGNGHRFGILAVRDFITTNNFASIIRAHECVPNGIRADFHGMVYTVFSSSNYSNEKDNNAGYIKIDSEGKIHCFNIPQEKQLNRTTARFTSYSPAKSLSDLKCGKMPLPTMAIFPRHHPTQFNQLNPRKLSNGRRNSMSSKVLPIPPTINKLPPLGKERHSAFL